MFQEKLSVLESYQNSFLYAGNKISWWPDQYFINLLGSDWNSLLQEYLLTVLNTMLGGTILYFVASLSTYYYFFIWKKKKFLPKYDEQMKSNHLKIANDIRWSLINIFVESWLVSVLRIMIPRWGKVYYDISEYGLAYFCFSIIFHMIYDETLTYWVHRWMHTFPRLYELLHRVHHKSYDVTPFSGFAFHPFDAFAQALGTFTSSFIFPLHMNIITLFSFLTPLWAISIHDNVPVLPFKLFLYATHHTIHHEPGKGQMANFGKFTSIWDRIMGSYCDPDRVQYGWQNENLETFQKLNKIYGDIIQDKSSKDFPDPQKKSSKKNIKNE